MDIARGERDKIIESIAMRLIGSFSSVYCKLKRYFELPTESIHTFSMEKAEVEGVVFRG